MFGNDTCVPGNGTSTCSPSGFIAGLAAGVTVLSLLIVIVVGALVYKYHRKMKSRNFLQSEQRRSQKDKGCSETLQVVSHQYITAGRQQSTSQAPIYENLTSQAVKYNRCSENQSRLSNEPGEDLYLQCDLPDDAIYSNDPACHLSYSQEDDVYIVPDS